MTHINALYRLTTYDFAKVIGHIGKGFPADGTLVRVLDVILIARMVDTMAAWLIYVCVLLHTDSHLDPSILVLP